MLLDDEEEEELTLLDHAERHNASFLDLVEIEFSKQRTPFKPLLLDCFFQQSERICIYICVSDQESAEVDDQLFWRQLVIQIVFEKI